MRLGSKASYNICELYDLLMESRVEEGSKGFWVWDMDKDLILYSPKFRCYLGYDGIHDFPNITNSYINAMPQKAIELTTSRLKTHIDSKGGVRFINPTTYKTKTGELKNVLCYGQLISWTGEDKPHIMVGLHMDGTVDLSRVEEYLINITK